MSVILRTRKFPRLVIMRNKKVVARFEPVKEQLTDDKEIIVGECVVRDQKMAKEIMKAADPSAKIFIVGRRSDQPLHVLEDEESQDESEEDDSEDESDEDDELNLEDNEEEEEEPEPEPEPKKRTAKKRNRK